MADKLKKFFKNKKLNTTFKRAGPGYKLNETPSSSTSSSQSEEYHTLPSRTGLTEETTKAAEAALARLEGKKRDTSLNKSFTAIQAQVKRELAAENERKLKKLAMSDKKVELEFQSPKVLAAQGVFFKCPLISPEVLPREEWHQKIRDFLYEQLAEEKGLTACLILHTLNKSQDKVNTCVDIITKYFTNILENPGEEKYRKIRVTNRAFQEKVMPMEGALQILEAAGFETKVLPHLEGEEEFLVYPEEKLGEAHDTLEMLIDALKNAEPITLELDRNLQVLLPSEAKERTHFPDTFYNLTIEDIKREQQLRTETVEKSQMLRTRAMRERDEIQEVRRYKFGVIRVRFPEQVLLQGTFGVHEKFSTVLEFVKDALCDENTKFTLTGPTGQPLNDENATLLDLKLIPATILNFQACSSKEKYLKPEVLALPNAVLAGS